MFINFLKTASLSLHLSDLKNVPPILKGLSPGPDEAGTERYRQANIINVGYVVAWSFLKNIGSSSTKHGLERYDVTSASNKLEPLLSAGSVSLNK